MEIRFKVGKETKVEIEPMRLYLCLEKKKSIADRDNYFLALTGYSRVYYIGYKGIESIQYDDLGTIKDGKHYDVLADITKTAEINVKVDI